MKKIWWIIPLCLLSFTPLYSFWISINSVNNIFTAVEFIKESINFKDISIKTAVPYDLVQDAIKKYCPQSAVNQAKQELAPLKEVWVSYLNQPNINKSLSDRFDMVKWVISEQKQENTYKYCKDSYLLFSILKTTQDLYSWEKEVKNKNTQNKVQKNETDLKSHSSAPTRKLDFIFNHNTSGLTIEAKKSFSESTEEYLQAIM